MQSKATYMRLSMSILWFGGLYVWLMELFDHPRKQLLVAADGVVFFILAFLDLLAHQVSSISHSLNAFKSLDIFIGMSEFLHTEETDD